MANQKYNWNEIEQEYVTGKLTYREIAVKHKVSESRIGVVGGKRDWAKKRKEYREGISTAAIEEAKKTTAFEKGRFDELVTRACDAVIAAMAQQGTDAYNTGRLNDKVSKSILSAVRDAQEIKYRALGVADKHEVKGSVTTIPELSDRALAIIDKAMATPESRSTLATALVPLKRFDANSGGNGSTGTNGHGNGNGKGT